MLVDGVRVMIVRELEAFIREIEMYPDDDLMWATLPWYRQLVRESRASRLGKPAALHRGGAWQERLHSHP